MKAIIIFVGVLCFFSCKEETSKNDSQSSVEVTQEIKTKRLTKKEIENITYTEYGLSSASKKGMTGWGSYKALEAQISKIKNADITYFEGDEEVIAAFISDLKSTIPEQVYSESVLARITALETKFYKLKSAVLIRQTPKEQLLENIQEFFVSFSNLNLQINKKFEKEAQDIYKSNL